MKKFPDYENVIPNENPQKTKTKKTRLVRFG